jgi:NTF2 fold immunity protein
MNRKLSSEQYVLAASEQPIDVLIQFMKEMNQWEKQCWEEHQEKKTTHKTMIQNLQRDLTRMNKIFAKYCTPKKRVHNLVGAYSFPPEYDSNNEIILEAVIESTRQVVIYTKQKIGFGVHLRYVLLRKGDQWLIDNKQWRINNGQKWKRGTL